MWTASICDKEVWGDWLAREEDEIMRHVNVIVCCGRSYMGGWAAGVLFAAFSSNGILWHWHVSGIFGGW